MSNCAVELLAVRWCACSERDGMRVRCTTCGGRAALIRTQVIQIPGETKPSVSAAYLCRPCARNEGWKEPEGTQPA